MDLGPIEAKPVRHYRPGAQILSIGSFGCSFRCPGCHNLEISWGTDALDQLARGTSTEAFASPAEIVDVAVKVGAEGIAFTYSEPAVWLEYVIDVSRYAHAAGLFTVYVSNSFVTPEALSEIHGYVDVLCSDIKSLDDDFYREICAKACVRDVLDSIKAAAALGIHVETRTNVIPGKNDDASMLGEIACWIRDNLGPDSPWHVTRFFPAYKLSHLPPTPVETLNEAAYIARELGLTNVYAYTDTGCDCAATNLPVGEWLTRPASELHAVKKCAAACCGDEGILLKKYEGATDVTNARKVYNGGSSPIVNFDADRGRQQS